MKRKAVIALALASSGLTMYGAQGTEYSFPTGKFVSIERDELPTYKEDSNVVYPVVNYFSVNMPNGDMSFSLRNEEGDELAVIRQEVGVTDRSGDESSNLVLAEKRAGVAAAYLKKKLAALGVSSPVITTENMGEYLSDQKDGSVNSYDRKVSVLIFPTI